MNRSNDITPRLREWINEPVSLPENGVERVARLVHDTPQQHGWLPPLSAGRHARVLTFAGGAVAGVAVAMLAGLVLLALVSEPESMAPVPAATTPSPTPSAEPPDWPGVTFEPLAGACPDGCDWARGGVWTVSADHHGDLGSVQAIDFDPDGAPWFLGDGVIWRFGMPEAHTIGGVLGDDLAVADDGTVWVASDAGLHAFDGEMWTHPFVGTNLDHIDIAPDGTVVALGRGRAGEAEGYPVVTLQPDGKTHVDTVDVLPVGRFPTDIVAAPDGRLWVAVIDSGYWPIATGESLIAYSDGAGWVADRSLGPDVSVAAGGFDRGPDGSIWTTLSTLPVDGDWGVYLARHDGRSWTLDQPEGVGLPYWTGPSVALDSMIWFPGPDVADDVPGGVVAFDGQAWTRYLAGQEIMALAVGPDGTALMTTMPGFDEDGQLLAIRHQR